MYDFHYNFILKKINYEQVKLLFTDTDSLCYEFKNFDIYNLIKENKDKFDLSNLDKNDELYDPINSKVLEKMKIETGSKIMDEFCGIRSKLYCYTIDKENEDHKRCKGVKKSVAEKDLNMELYKKCIFDHNNISVSQNVIRSYSHQLYTETVNKVALNFNDDKLYICEDNINTFKFGYKGNNLLFRKLNIEQ